MDSSVPGGHPIRGAPFDVRVDQRRCARLYGLGRWWKSLPVVQRNPGLI